MPRRNILSVLAAALASLPLAASAAELFNNGPFITSPTGGTGNIAGQALSRPENFPLTPTLNGSSPGINTNIFRGQKVADDFIVPGGGWDLDQITVYAYQAPPGGATTFSQTITKVQINLWNTTPYSEFSPSLPPGLPIPQPMLAQPLEFDVTGQGVFVAHRTSGSSTTTIRPIYAFTLSAEGLPNGGKLEPGQYWLEMSFDDAGPTHSTVAVPLVTPRSAAANLNARVFNVPFGTEPQSWFEGREGFGLSSVIPEGRPYALPFALTGTPEPATLSTLVAGAMLSLRRTRRG